jgi:hypothetical protein
VRGGKIQAQFTGTKIPWRKKKRPQRADSRHTTGFSRKNQMSQTQLRAKIGATLADNEAGTVGEMETVSVLAKTQTTNTGTEEMI